MTKKKTRRRRPANVLQGRVAEISKRLQTVRLERRLSQAEVADLVGVTQAAMSRWEDPEHTTIPSAAEVVELAVFYGVSVDWLCALSPFRQALPPGQALVDLDLSFGAVWTSIPEGACVTEHDDVLRRVRAVDKHVRKLSPKLWERWMRGVLGAS